jgi:cytochrome-b5 reductase
MFRFASLRTTACALGATALSWKTLSCDAVFSQSEFKPFKILVKEKVNHNVNLYRVDLGAGNTMGMTTAGLVQIQGKDKDGKVVARPYTPVSRDTNTKGYMELLVKSYPDGNVSKYLTTLEVGDDIHIKGPFTKMEIKPNFKKEIGLIAGGSGLTPMLQIAEELLENPSDKTKITLVFCNQTEDDIFFRRQLDRLEETYPRFKVVHMLSKPGVGWTGKTGRITKEEIRELMPAPGPDSMIFVCGPPGMYDSVCGPMDFNVYPPGQGALGGYLKDMGYESTMVKKL